MPYHRRLSASTLGLIRMTPLCLAVPLLMAATLPATAQELHPDWARVWNRDAQPPAPGSMTIPAGVVLPVALDAPLSSRFARVGDIVTATPVSRVSGDSEFPPGTRLGGVVSQAQSAYGSTPGVLDVDFQSALLPDGSDVPLHGFIASLDSGSVVDRNGRLIARDSHHVNAWKAIGIGGGIGFVLGRLLRTRTLVPTILGATGAYLYARSNSHGGEDAQIAQGTTLGVRLESSVSFPDPSDYARVRLSYLESHHAFEPEHYGWRPEVCAPPRERYSNYTVVVERPIWVTVDPFDYYGYPLVPVWAPRPYREHHDWDRDDHRDYRDDHHGDGDDHHRDRDDHRDYHHAPIRHFGDGAPFRPSLLNPDFGRREQIVTLPRIEPKRDERRPVVETRPRHEVFVGRPRFEAPAIHPQRDAYQPREQREQQRPSFVQQVGRNTQLRPAPHECEHREATAEPRKTRR